MPCWIIVTMAASLVAMAGLFLAAALTLANDYDRHHGKGGRS
jgi:hypothetical protein